YGQGTFRTDVLAMVNPFLTLVFDIAVIGAAACILAAIYQEHRASRSRVAGRRPVAAFRAPARPRSVTVGAVQRRRPVALTVSAGKRGLRRQGAARRNGIGSLANSF